MAIEWINEMARKAHSLSWRNELGRSRPFHLTIQKVSQWRVGAEGSAEDVDEVDLVD